MLSTLLLGGALLGFVGRPLLVIAAAGLSALVDFLL